MKTLVIILLLIFNLLTILYYSNLKKSYKDDFTLDERREIHRCLLEDRRRKLLMNQDAHEMDYLIAKWEVVAEVELPKQTKKDV